MSAALAAGIAAALMSLVTGVICAFLAVLHHARLIRSGCGIPNTELRHNALRQPLRLALHHLELSAEAMCPPMTVNTLPVPRNRKARSLGPLLVLFLPLALAQLVVVAVLAVTCGTAASAAQRAARRGAAALVNAQTGHPGAGFMVILHSAVATLAFALATPVLLPGLPAAHTAAFSPVWLCQRPDESAFEAVSPAATSRAASPSSASLHASTSLHMVGHSDVSNAVRVVSRQATRLESRESGTAGRSSPARLPSAPMSRSAWSPVSRLSPVPPVSPVSSITDTAQQAWSAPSSPTPRLTSVSVASLPPSGAEPLRLASAASTSTAPNRLPSLRSSEEMAAAAAIDVPMPLSTPRGSPPSHLPRSMLSAPDKGLPIVYKPRSLTLVHARLLSEALDTSFGSVSNRSEMAAHVALWAAEQEPGAMVPLAPSIGAYFLRLLVGYASLAQMASSPGEAGACVVAAFMPALLLALLWCILLPLLPLALLLPSCLPFSRLRALLLQRGTTWFVVQLQPWLCLLALIHAYARLSEAEITLLLRWVSLLAWAIVAALLLLLSRHMCVSVRWFLGWFWACNLMTTALLLTAVVGEVDRSLKLGAADPVARGALSVHVAIAAYVAVSGLILRGTKRRTLGIVLPVAAQVLAPTTALASDECGLAVACRASALGPAGTLVELRAAHAFAPATNRSMSLAQFLLGEVRVIEAPSFRRPLLRFQQGDRIVVYDEWYDWYYGQGPTGEWGWLPIVLAGKLRRNAGEVPSWVRGRRSRLLKKAWHKLRAAFLLYPDKPRDDEALPKLTWSAVNAWTHLVLMDVTAVAMVVVGSMQSDPGSKRLVLALLVFVLIYSIIMVLVLIVKALLASSLPEAEAEQAADEAVVALHAQPQGTDAQDTVVLVQRPAARPNPQATTVANADVAAVEDDLSADAAFPSQDSVTLPGSFA